MLLYSHQHLLPTRSVLHQDGSPDMPCTMELYCSKESNTHFSYIDVYVYKCIQYMYGWRRDAVLQLWCMRRDEPEEQLLTCTCLSSTNPPPRHHLTFIVINRWCTNIAHCKRHTYRCTIHSRGREGGREDRGGREEGGETGREGGRGRDREGERDGDAEERRRNAPTLLV